MLDFSRFTEMLQNVTLGGILIIVGILAAIIVVAVLIAKSRARKNRASPRDIRRNQNAASALRQLKQMAGSQGATIEDAPLYVSDKDRKLKSEIKIVKYLKQYGTGDFKAMVFTKENNIDFTSIPTPVGQVYQFDTSLPISGAGYIVEENKITGNLVECRARSIDIITKELPEWAWFAINGKSIIKRFWQVPAPWWQSVSMWFAAGMLVIVFIAFLAVFGG